MRYVQVLDRAPQALGHPAGSIEVRSLQQDGEFFAAIASREIAGACDGLPERGGHGERLAIRTSARTRHQDFAYLFQAAVARNVSVLVVEQLEMINIDDEHGDRRCEFGGRSPFRRELPVESTTICNSGQRVRGGKLPQWAVALAQVLLATGDLLRHVIKGGGEG